MRYVTFYMSICAAFCCQFLSIPLFAQQQKVDTMHTYFIPEVTVSDIYQTREVRSTAPLQLFSKEALKNLHALQVSDAVKHFAGVTVKDYGGIGGLKTVSIRSLGAQHTVVGYDGIAITDCLWKCSILRTTARRWAATWSARSTATQAARCCTSPVRMATSSILRTST